MTGNLRSGLRWFCLLSLGTVMAQPGAGSWVTVTRDNLCVTEGAIEKSGGSDLHANNLHVNVPKMRAFATIPAAPSAEVRFTYLGPTAKSSALGSGEMRRQFGLKLRAQDPCNLVYVMWRIEPESKLVVSVKRNEGEHTSAECGNRGYQNIKPRKATAVPRLEVNQSHTLRAEMHGDELRVFADNHEVWEGSVGSDAAQLEGPVGIRSDNAMLDFDLKTRTPESAKSRSSSCKSGMDSD
jgi:hypothetical protein